jgi:Zn-finger nucleic acid-binding protein
MVFEQGFRTERLACPNCGTLLVEIDRSEIMIDACPGCRGVWLDRGELDRLLDKERRLSAGVENDDQDFIRQMRGEPRAAPRAAPPAAADDDRFRQRDGYPRHDHDDDDDFRYERGKRRKRRSLLEEIFDFD